jgi:hypothetical protein
MPKMGMRDKQDCDQCARAVVVLASIWEDDKRKTREEEEK